MPRLTWFPPHWLEWLFIAGFNGAYPDTGPSPIGDRTLGNPVTTRLRLLNALPGTDRHQLSLTGELDPMTPGQELFSSRQFNELSAFRNANSGRYRVRVIRNGDPADVVFDYTGLTLRGGESGTWVLAPVPGSNEVSLALFLQGTSGLVLTNQLP